MTSRCFITLNQAKNYLGVAIDNATFDTLMEEWIDFVCGGIEDYIQNKVNLTTIADEIMDGSGTVRLYPRYYPIYSITKVEYLTTHDGTWVEYDLSDIIVHPDREAAIELIDGSYFYWGKSNHRLNYVAGWGTLPANLQIVALEKLQVMWNESKKFGDALGKQSMADNSVLSSTIAWKGMEPRWNKIMDSYKRISI